MMHIYMLPILLSNSAIFCYDLKFAHIKTNHSGEFELSGALETSTQLTLIKCTLACAINDQCVTFFYENETGQCVLHSKDFIFQRTNPPSNSRKGVISEGHNWKQFVLRDGTGRCPPPYFYYKNLDFCYVIHEIDEIVESEINTTCRDTGGRLAAVDTHQKWEYFRYILSNRQWGLVPIAGHRISYHSWSLENGQRLTYFNWDDTEPSSVNDKCLVLWLNDLFHDAPCDIDIPGTFVCEV